MKSSKSSLMWRLLLWSCNLIWIVILLLLTVFFGPKYPTNELKSLHTEYAQIKTEWQNEIARPEALTDNCQHEFWRISEALINMRVRAMDKMDKAENRHWWMHWSIEKAYWQMMFRLPFGLDHGEAMIQGVIQRACYR